MGCPGWVREARLHKWSGPAQLNYNWVANSRASPACVGHEQLGPFIFYFKNLVTLSYVLFIY